MKKALCIALMLSFCLAGRAFEVVRTGNTSIVLEAVPGENLRILHYGADLSDADIASLKASGVKSLNAYPFFGPECNREVALSAVQPDGNTGLNLLVKDIQRKTWEGGEILEITCRDDIYPFEVKSVYKSYSKENIIGTWTEILNDGRKPVTLLRFDSGYLPIRVGDVWVAHQYGAWGDESRVCTEPLNRGMLTIKNKDGNRTDHLSRSEVMIGLDGKPQENSGRVIGAALCWAGNYELRFDTDDTRYHSFFAGINPDNSTWTLAGGEVFVTPELALSFSSEGLGGVSRNFHRWARAWKLHDGTGRRPILLNSWEGVHMDIKEPEMEQMMRDIADMGGEMFVIDDGWFCSEKYKRDNDKAALGDWDLDLRKLPSGIGHMTDFAASQGLKFGIWIEPEMVNSKSELFEKHPDWIITDLGREPVYGRGGSQLLLDMSNPLVQDYVFKIFDGVMTASPDIAYIKWDCNYHMKNSGSQYLKNQQHVYIEFIRGLCKTLDRIRAKYPDVIIQCCASGGARVSYGLMPWFDEFWTSDQTSAHQRILIQWGTSYFYPAIAMGAHISASPDLHTNMTASLKYRVDVASSGRLGMELQPSKMSEDEKAFCRKAIETYKDIRPIVQQGDLYRLVSPYDDAGFVSLMYCTPEKDRAVFYWWKTENYVAQVVPAARMAGLDPDRMYTVKELNRDGSKALSFEGKTFSGRFLMDVGLNIPVNRKNPTESRMLLLY